MESDVRLTRAQKWDLVRMSAAAIVSTAFFAIPLLLARPNAAPQPAQSPAPRPEVMTAGVTQPSPTDAVAPRVAETVTVVRTNEIAEITTPALQASARRIAPVMTQAKQRSEQPTPFSRRLARFFAGNGKYGVKPFPSVNTSGS